MTAAWRMAALVAAILAGFAFLFWVWALVGAFAPGVPVWGPSRLLLATDQSTATGLVVVLTLAGVAGLCLSVARLRTECAATKDFSALVRGVLAEASTAAERVGRFEEISVGAPGLYAEIVKTLMRAQRAGGSPRPGSLVEACVSRRLPTGSVTPLIFLCTSLGFVGTLFGMIRLFNRITRGLESTHRDAASELLATRRILQDAIGAMDTAVVSSLSAVLLGGILLYAFQWAYRLARDAFVRELVLEVEADVIPVLHAARTPSILFLDSDNTRVVSLLGPALDRFGSGVAALLPVLQAHTAGMASFAGDLKSARAGLDVVGEKLGKIEALLFAMGNAMLEIIARTDRIRDDFRALQGGVCVGSPPVGLLLRLWRFLWR